MTFRVAVMALALALAGCGDDTTAAVSQDMAQPLIDLAQKGLTCGPSYCTGTCAACVPLGGGFCAPPCMTSDPNSCTAPAMCRPLGGDSDAGGTVTLVGSCAGYDGYCG